MKRLSVEVTDEQRARLRILAANQQLTQKAMLAKLIDDAYQDFVLREYQIDVKEGQQ